MTEETTKRERHTAESAILSLIEARGPIKTICPTDAARLVNPDYFRKALPDVRSAAVRLALAGQIAIYRHNKPVDPMGFKGVYRLGAVRGVDGNETIF
jgi:Protein of unknown function (DUF3253)